MPRAKRGVKFTHKANNGHTDGARRSSMSDYSEEGSQQGSPTKSKSGQQHQLDGIAEVCLVVPSARLLLRALHPLNEENHAPPPSPATSEESACHGVQC